MIIYKWLHAWGDNPPNILNIMINLYKKPEKDGQLFENPDYQLTIQMRILCKEMLFRSKFKDIALICVPVMLILKPVFEIIKMKREHNSRGHGAEHG
jgi:hypothetical protein